MKTRLNLALKMAGLTGLMTLSACSTMKDLSNVNLWPFGQGDAPREYRPTNSVAYKCDANKSFFVRTLENGASVWLMLPDREVLLPQTSVNKVYSNGISRLDLSSADVTLDVSDTIKYTACTIKTDAALAKTDTWVAKPEVKKVEVPVLASPAVLPVVLAPKVAEAVAALPAPIEPQKVEPVKAAPAENVASKEADAEQAPVTNPQADVAKALDVWANAWRTKNAEAYLKAYADKFQPEGMAKLAWVKQRQLRVGQNPAEITLTLDKVNIAADAKKAVAIFVQHYSSAQFSDNVTKVLTFENINGQWLIVKESAKAATAK